MISILTPSYNQGAYIEENIRSVLGQRYDPVEHIVIDGGSTDDTITVLKRYPHLRWISEPDRGQADALNKALRLASGDIVGWINSDDFYAPGVFSRIASVFEDDQVQWCIGDVVNYDDRSGAEQYVKSPDITYQALLRDPDAVRQQGAFFRASAIRAAGPWDPDLHMVMDLDLWLRLAHACPPLMVHRKTAYFRVHPAQKTQLSACIRQTGEIERVLLRHGVSGARRLCYRTKRRFWWLKGVMKVGLQNAGLAST